MFCSNCGANVPEGTAYCGACGRAVAGASVPTAAGVAIPSGGAAIAAPVHYAGFWLRFVAILIDGIVLFAVLFVPIRAFVAASGFSMGEMANPWVMRHAMRVFFFPRFFGLIVAWLYFALLESSSWQATLGKKALGLYVTDLNGQRISFGRATGRYFAKIVSNLTLCIGYIMAGFTARKQALHDIIAGCLVLRKV
jgi:uncharacterized RDD family membrane protein YckC